MTIDNFRLHGAAIPNPKSAGPLTMAQVEDGMALSELR